MTLGRGALVSSLVSHPLFVSPVFVPPSPQASRYIRPPPHRASSSFAASSLFGGRRLEPLPPGSLRKALMASSAPQGLIFGLGSLAVSTPYLGGMLALIIAGWLFAASPGGDWPGLSGSIDLFRILMHRHMTASKKTTTTQLVV